MKKTTAIVTIICVLLVCVTGVIVTVLLTGKRNVEPEPSMESQVISNQPIQTDPPLATETPVPTVPPTQKPQPTIDLATPTPPMDDPVAQSGNITLVYTENLQREEDFDIIMSIFTGLYSYSDEQFYVNIEHYDDNYYYFSVDPTGEYSKLSREYMDALEPWDGVIQ